MEVLSENTGGIESSASTSVAAPASSPPSPICIVNLLSRDGGNGDGVTSPLIGETVDEAAGDGGAGGVETPRRQCTTLTRQNFRGCGSSFDATDAAYDVYFPFPFANSIIRDELSRERASIDDSVTALAVPSVPVYVSLLALLLDAGRRDAPLVRTSHDALSDMIALLTLLEHKADVSTPQRKQVVSAQLMLKARACLLRFERALRTCASTLLSSIETATDVPQNASVLNGELRAAERCARNYILERLNMYEFAVATLIGIPGGARYELLTPRDTSSAVPPSVRARLVAENARFARKRLVFAHMMAQRRARGIEMPPVPRPPDMICDDEARRLLGRVPSDAEALRSAPLDAVRDMLHYMFFDGASNQPAQAEESASAS